jgi:hypothetical protein
MKVYIVSCKIHRQLSVRGSWVCLCNHNVGNYNCRVWPVDLNHEYIFPGEVVSEMTNGLNSVSVPLPLHENNTLKRVLERGSHEHIRFENRRSVHSFWNTQYRNGLFTRRNGTVGSPERKTRNGKVRCRDGTNLLVHAAHEISVIGQQIHWPTNTLKLRKPK